MLRAPVLMVKRFTWIAEEIWFAVFITHLACLCRMKTFLKTTLDSCSKWIILNPCVPTSLMCKMPERNISLMILDEMRSLLTDHLIRHNYSLTDMWSANHQAATQCLTRYTSRATAKWHWTLHGCLRQVWKIPETADLLGVSHKNISRVSRECLRKRKYPVRDCFLFELCTSVMY